MASAGKVLRCFRRHGEKFTKGCDKFNPNLWNNFKESIDTTIGKSIIHGCQ